MGASQEGRALFRYVLSYHWEDFSTFKLWGISFWVAIGGTLGEFPSGEEALNMHMTPPSNLVFYSYFSVSLILWILLISICLLVGSRFVPPRSDNRNIWSIRQKALTFFRPFSPTSNRHFYNSTAYFTIHTDYLHDSNHTSPTINPTCSLESGYAIPHSTPEQYCVQGGTLLRK